MNRVLEDREKRYNKILDLIETYKLPVICGKINYPGINKNTNEAEKAFSILQKFITDEFEPYLKHTFILSGYDGKSIIGAVNMDSHEAKKIGISIEEGHKLGRIFDIDIYVENGYPLERESINHFPRRCAVCSDEARVCIKFKRHSLEETLDVINRLINSFGE